MSRLTTLVVGLGLVAGVARAENLEVALSSPQGEVETLQEANEVRVVFSEPMVALGRIPQPVAAPFLSIVPKLEGSLRWSGTKTLIFTPRDLEKVPYATRFTVKVDASATSAAGNKLARPYSFTFTTPTVRLTDAQWQRVGGRFDAPVVILLRFNQPITGSAILPHLALRYQPHDWKAPGLAPAVLELLAAVDPQAATDYAAKVARTQLATQSRESVPVKLAADWDKKQYPPSDDLVAVVTDGVPPTDAWIHIGVGPAAPGRQGKQSPGKPQENLVKLDPTFFVDAFRCSAGCDPDGYNPLRLRASVELTRLRAAVKVRDFTNPAKPTPLKQAPAKKAEASEEGEESYDRSSDVTLEDTGYSLHPASSYLVSVDRGLTARDGQTLGYTWIGALENWHQRAYTSFGSGHGVWEASGGPELPFYARNLRSVTQWLSPLRPDELMPTVRKLQEKNFELVPAGPGTDRKLTPKADTVQSFGVDTRTLLGAGGTGLLWATLRDGETIAKSQYADLQKKPHSTVVQVTNLGLSVKDSPQGVLVFVTRLDNAEPVPGATVAIRNLDNTVLWTGTTDADGIAISPALELRSAERSWEFRFLVTAEKDGDVAYVGSDWNDGLESWNFGINYDLEEAQPLLRGAVFSDRGVYKLGEELHLKAILRSDTARGIVLFPPGTKVELVLKDSQGGEVDKRTLALSEWGSADYAVKLPEDGPLGRYEVAASVTGIAHSVSGGFLVAAYRRPDFRVDGNLAGESSLAGVTLKGVITGRYLFGAAMAEREARWAYSKKALSDVPRAIADRFPVESWAFLDQETERTNPDTDLTTGDAKLDRDGQLTLDLETDAGAGQPFEYRLEGRVTDVSRQTIAGRAAFRVDPAPWYLGLKQPPFFVDVASGLDTELVAVDVQGKPAAGVATHVTLTKVQWHSVRRAEGAGYYTWETEKREVPAGEWNLTSAATAVPLHVPVEDGGFYVLRAKATDAGGHSTTTATGFYVLGAGYTAWQRYDHNRIDLVPEKKTYRPGETARIMIKSPWEKATALLTTEREGVRTHRTFRLASTQETVSVPITDNEVPNVSVSVLLVKGRSGAYSTEDQSDPGKPAFRVGYVELRVDDGSKRLAVKVKADKQEYRPATRARIEVSAQDAKGQPAAAEVTLWAVDYGVLSLTGYKTPDVMPAVWVAKALQVMNEDSRQNIISRRVVVTKGDDEGGGGGVDEGPGSPVRRDFRVLAFWLGSVATDARGRASADVTLPESLTTYRIMAVAGDKASRFGFGEQEIQISKPVLLKPAFPRFLARGDTALFGSVVHNQLADKGTAIVTLRSLDPDVLEVQGEAKQTLEVKGKGSAEVRFPVIAKAIGNARLQMTVKLLGESDAFEETLPVRVLASPEVVAAYGSAAPDAREALELPAGVLPGFGGLHVETASTAMVGLGEGARYLVDYPYGCAEQRSSAALALMLAADLGNAFSLPGIESGKLREVTASTLKELEGFQCDEGGFAFWKGDCRTASPYVTSHVLHVYQRGQQLGYAVPTAALDKAYAYLEKELGATQPTSDGWWPAHAAWQSFAVKVLAEGGHPQDSHVTRLFGRLDRMPVFALAYLLDAITAKGEKGARPAELLRRIKNAILPEGGSAHVEELADPYLLWFWSSNPRSTAIALGSIVRDTTDATLVPGLVRWLLQVRTKGRWGNTQENALAMEALVDYYKKYESETPDFQALVSLGTATLARQEFRGRASQAQVKDVPMQELLASGPAGQRLDLGFKREGTGTLFYSARLRYAADQADAKAMDQGFRLERSYAPQKQGAATTTYAAGDLVKVTLKLAVTKERRFVAVTDPVPAGFEPVESWFATTASDLAKAQQSDEQGGSWLDWWQRGGFDRVERHDDRVLLFATRLAEGVHEFSYVVRATTSGTFRTAPAHAEEMYQPEVFGRTPSETVTVKP